MVQNMSQMAFPMLNQNGRQVRNPDPIRIKVTVTLDIGTLYQCIKFESNPFNFNEDMIF